MQGEKEYTYVWSPTSQIINKYTKEGENMTNFLDWWGPDWIEWRNAQKDYIPDPQKITFDTGEDVWVDVSDYVRKDDEPRR